MTTNAERFLSIYKSVEEALEAKCRAEGRSVSNPVFRYLEEAESEPIREKLDLCRQVRNLIVHSADIGGHPPVQPSDELVRILEKCCDYICRPPLALRFATPADKLLQAQGSDRVKWLMRRMAERGFSHVPVMEERTLTGVFSATTPFAITLNGGTFGDHTRLSEIREALKTDSHPTERFIFIAPDVTTAQAVRLFERTSRHEKRVAALFITEDGTPHSPLMGMLTPWDLMGRHLFEAEAAEEA